MLSYFWVKVWHYLETEKEKTLKQGSLVKQWRNKKRQENKQRNVVTSKEKACTKSR